MTLAGRLVAMTMAATMVKETGCRLEKRGVDEEGQGAGGMEEGVEKVRAAWLDEKEVAEVQAAWPGEKVERNKCCSPGNGALVRLHSYEYGYLSAELKQKRKFELRCLYARGAEIGHFSREGRALDAGKRSPHGLMSLRRSGRLGHYQEASKERCWESAVEEQCKSELENVSRVKFVALGGGGRRLWGKTSIIYHGVAVGFSASAGRLCMQR